MIPHDLSSTNTTQLRDLTAHIDVSDLREIPGWTLLTTDSSEVSSDTSTRGRQGIQKNIDENNSHMERASFEADRAQRREERHRTYTNRKPPATHNKSKLENQILQTNTWKRDGGKIPPAGSRLNAELKRAKTTGGPVQCTTPHTNTSCLGRGPTIRPNNTTRNGNG